MAIERCRNIRFLVKSSVSDNEQMVEVLLFANGVVLPLALKTGNLFYLILLSQHILTMTVINDSEEVKSNLESNFNLADM